MKDYAEAQWAMLARHGYRYEHGPGGGHMCKGPLGYPVPDGERRKARDQSDAAESAIMLSKCPECGANWKMRLPGDEPTRLLCRDCRAEWSPFDVTGDATRAPGVGDA